MLEREPKRVDTNSIRLRAHTILASSTDVLAVNYSSIWYDLAPQLQSFMNEKSKPPVKEMSGSIERELGETLFFDAVNFCFKDPVTRKEYFYQTKDKKYTRSSALHAAIKNADVNWENFIEVAALSPEKWDRITQISDSNPLYLGAERGVRIRGFARHLLESGYKNPNGFLEAMEYDSDKILSFLANSNYFNDEFLKRAQLTVTMLDGVLSHYGQKGLKNTNKLTAMADYRIPQVFYNLGTIKLAPYLEEKLMKEEPIESGSREELALRATVITVSEELSKILGLNESQIDGLLWPLSQKMAKGGELPIPHMLVATDKY